MIRRNCLDRYIRLSLIGIGAGLAALALEAAPADAFWIGFNFPFFGCCYAPPPPYYAYPPPAYYPPSYDAPPAGYYAPNAATNAAAPSISLPATSSAYTPAPPSPAYPPPAATGSQPAPGPTAQVAPATPAISYTSKPAFTNAAGQTCREYKTSDGVRDVFGTACKQNDGLWRVVN